MWCLSTHPLVLQAPNLMPPTKKPKVSSDPDIEDTVHRLHLLSPKWEWEYSSQVGRKCQNVCTHTGTRKCTYIYVHRCAYACMSECCCLVTKSCLTFCDPPWTSAHQASLSFTISGVCSNSCPLSWWCYRSISFSVTYFSTCLQSFPASGSFSMSQPLYQVANVLKLQLQSF